MPNRTCCTDAHEDGIVDLSASADDDSGEWIDICAAAAAKGFEEYLTPEEVGRILRVHRDSVIRRFEGRPGVLDLGAPECGKKRQYRVLRIPRAAVDRFIAEHRAA
jgi:hypothetical protein